MEYTDLTILDCNRQHSIQKKSGNTENSALFTNELGRGITLNVGDKVSVQNAYISEVGAGSDTIEFKGESLGKKRTINYIKEENEYPTTLRDNNPNIGQAYNPLITGYQRLKSVEDTFTYEVKDNETYISNQYYINTNGESGYVFLPRRFVYPATFNATAWTNADSYSAGQSSPQLAGQFASCDYQFIYGGNAYDNFTITGGFYRLKSDNSRLTLMRRIDTTSTDLRPDITRDNQGITYINGRLPDTLEPSRSKYVIYQDYFKVSVDKGFTSSDNLGDEITNQLKQESRGTDFQYIDDTGNTRTITKYYETNTYKPFLCGSIDTFKKAQLDEYNKSNTDQSKDKHKSQDYYSNYYNIYCKRPELRIQGQRFQYDSYIGYEIEAEIAYGNRKTSSIITSIPFTEESLSLLKDYFYAQSLYPELFDNDNFHTIVRNVGSLKTYSVDNVRYLHMTPADVLEEYGDLAGIGGDNLNTTQNASGLPIELSKQSIPVFIHFDKDNENKYTDGSSINNLCYGFATNSGGYIRLHPELASGINDRAFGPATNKNIKAGTRIGYDFSFNSYGSVYACGINGICEKDYQAVNEWSLQNGSNLKSTSGLMRYMYVGSNNPSFKYDDEQTRFYFSGLHTPELAGQSDVGAGDNSASPPQEDNTENGVAVVYKINKRVNKYLYTPDMKPYDSVVKGKYTPTEGTNLDRTLVIRNRNITPWSIFDSVSGVFFTDLGYDKEDFDKGLFGILGFTYDQLFSILTSENNRTLRVNNDLLKKKNMSIITTNSALVSSDTRNYSVNQFGGVYYTGQIPLSSVITYHSTDHAHSLVNQIDPAITQGTSSIQILADNLPRKMLKPYYTIRSDIIDNNHYVGGEDSKSVLPVVALCDKQYSGGDFYFGGDNQFTFTITKKKVITTITTAITDPNQSFARVDDDSSVIYRIEKNRTAEQDLVVQYLKSLESKK
jgi:hypothetical protein